MSEVLCAPYADLQSNEVKITHYGLQH